MQREGKLAPLDLTAAVGQLIAVAAFYHINRLLVRRLCGVL